MHSRFSNSFALICLVGTVWTVVATSSSDGTFSAIYNVHSDCVSPPINTQLSIVSSVITSPSGMNYNTLGFPTNALDIGQDNAGTYSTGYRDCKMVLQDGKQDGDPFLYACSDNGAFSCNIYFGN